MSTFKWSTILKCRLLNGRLLKCQQHSHPQTFQLPPETYEQVTEHMKQVTETLLCMAWNVSYAWPENICMGPKTYQRCILLPETFTQVTFSPSTHAHIYLKHLLK